MNKRPVAALAIILIAAGASAFTAFRRFTDYLYLPNGAGAGEYEHVQADVHCPYYTTTGCLTFVDSHQGLKQLYTTINNITVPLKSH